MSDSPDAPLNDTSATADSQRATPATAAGARQSMPSWLIAGVLGVLIGGIGGFLLAKYGYGHGVKVITMPANAGESYGKPPGMGAPDAKAP
jgi:hypothetical protein